MEMLKMCGSLQSCKVHKTDEKTYALATFDSDEDAQAAVNLYHKKEIFGMELYVQKALNNGLLLVLGKLAKAINLGQQQHGSEALFVKNFPQTVTYEQVRKFLAMQGSIQKLTIRDVGNKKAAVVSFHKPEHAAALLEKIFLNFENSMLIVEKFVRGAKGTNIETLRQIKQLNELSKNPSLNPVFNDRSAFGNISK